MNTIILFWNPAISSYKLENFQEEMEDIVYADMNWSVWEHEKAHAGDRFFMVRCGSGKTGICMSGYFTSEPYQGEDWSGKGRVTYYMNMEADFMIHPDYLPILTTSELINEIPSFDWVGGHSGRLLDADKAEKLEKMWKKFTEDHADMFAIRAACQELNPNSYSSIHSDEQTIYLLLTREGKVAVSDNIFDIDIEGDDLDGVKKQTINEIYKKSGKKPQIKFKYIDAEENETLIYEKALRLVLANKKEGTEFHVPYGDINEKLVYLLHKVVVTPQELISQDFPDEVVEAVKVLERKSDEAYIDYVKRAVQNELSREIIREEIDDALYIDKSKESLDAEDFKIINENLQALHYLKSLEGDE